MFTCVRACVPLGVCRCARVCVCVCVYDFGARERERERECVCGVCVRACLHVLHMCVCTCRESVCVRGGRVAGGKGTTGGNLIQIKRGGGGKREERERRGGVSVED